MGFRVTLFCKMSWHCRLLFCILFYQESYRHIQATFATYTLPRGSCMFLCGFACCCLEFRPQLCSLNVSGLDLSLGIRACPVRVCESKHYRDHEPIPPSAADPGGGSIAHCELAHGMRPKAELRHSGKYICRPRCCYGQLPKRCHHACNVSVCSALYLSRHGD